MSGVVDEKGFCLFCFFILLFCSCLVLFVCLFCFFDLGHRGEGSVISGLWSSQGGLVTTLVRNRWSRVNKHVKLFCLDSYLGNTLQGQRVTPNSQLSVPCGAAGCPATKNVATGCPTFALRQMLSSARKPGSLHCLTLSTCALEKSRPFLSLKTHPHAPRETGALRASPWFPAHC